MYLRELSLDDFKSFAETNIIANAYQSVSYAMLKAEEGYDYEFIGLISDNKVIAAALILYKKIVMQLLEWRYSYRFLKLVL